MAIESQLKTHPREQLLQSLQTCRETSELICSPLHAEDTCIQTMADVSPPKWHLAHTSWFFETFILSAFDPAYELYHAEFDRLFNSYYVTHGEPYPRPQRGLLSRPTYDEVLQYRQHVDRAMQSLLMTVDESRYPQLVDLVILGINHEQQHQELLYTDIKHIFAHNPMQPVYLPTSLQAVNEQTVADDIAWLEHAGGIIDIGHMGDEFAFDNEAPAHKVLVQDFMIADRLITNAEYLAFIEDGGYQRPELWMSEGWATVKQQSWQAPLYWQMSSQDDVLVFGLNGVQPLEPAAPVCHVSYYEADAYARWADARLPTEFEWELAVAGLPVQGNLRGSGLLRPVAATDQQFFGDVWEWTASPYTAYPGYRPAGGSIGEYNGKFMSNQMVLRGGSCVTPQQHIRATYRNFFYPPDRWQFSGIRLAKFGDK